MKKAFTLVELIAVVIIIGLVALLTIPNILKSINATKNELSDAMKEIIVSAGKLYASDNNLPKTDNYNYCITLKKLVAENYLESNLKDPSTKKEISLDKYVQIHVFNNNYEYEVLDTCTPSTYADNSGANKPEIDNGLVPILYDGKNWVVADTSFKWYDYDNKEWANAIIVKPDKKAEYITEKVVVEDDVLAYYVWIPKYEYKVNGKEEVINVNFKKSSDEVATTNYIMHPAFTFGTTKLNGIWVGKFETTGTGQNPTIKPNVTSLRSQNISTQFVTAQKFGINAYGLSGIDAHMMKNIEWGAVAYLKQSKYGLGATDIVVNTSASYLTGNGDYKTNINQSTTGNITGIYDISGGAWEYVMGNYNNTLASSGFSSMPNAKYYDLYTSSIGIKGDATNADGTNGWYDDYAYFIVDNSPWFIRGGGYSYGSVSGTFGFANADGIGISNNAFRAVITKP